MELESPEWCFMWATGRPYICTIVGLSRRAVIHAAEKSQGITWKKIYGRGGRVARCNITLKAKP